MKRLWEIDALRGLMLVLMTATHMPTRFAQPFGQPFGYVSAAEGFVLLSGFMAGVVYTRRRFRSGVAQMRSAFIKRAVRIYACQAALLVFLFTIIALIGVLRDQPAVTNLIRFYLDHPLHALIGSLLLLYNPPLLDILPLYVLFVLASPVLLLHGMRHGWTPVLLASAALWLGAQFDLGRVLYEHAATIARWPVPFRDAGSFDTLAWQVLWVVGLWLGATFASDEAPHPLRFSRSIVRIATTIVIVGFVWRHAAGQIPAEHWPSVNRAFDKWHLGPLRMVNLAAMFVVTLHYGPRLIRALPRLHWLETLGAASLPVFVAHLVIVLLALAFVGESTLARSWSTDTALMLGAYLALYAVAAVTLALDRRTAELRERLKTRGKTIVIAGARRLQTSTTHSPPR